MKKIIYAIALIMIMSVGANAQTDDFFEWNNLKDNNERYNDPTAGINFSLPLSHGSDDDAEAPLGTGLLILTALGAGYATARKKRNGSI